MPQYSVNRPTTIKKPHAPIRKTPTPYPPTSRPTPSNGYTAQRFKLRLAPMTDPCPRTDPDRTVSVPRPQGQKDHRAVFPGPPPLRIKMLLSDYNPDLSSTTPSPYSSDGPTSYWLLTTQHQMTGPNPRTDPAHTPPATNRLIQKAKDLSRRFSSIVNQNHQTDSNPAPSPPAPLSTRYQQLNRPAPNRDPTWLTN